MSLIKIGLGTIVMGSATEATPRPQLFFPTTVKFPETSVKPNEIGIVFPAVLMRLPFGKVHS